VDTIVFAGLARLCARSAGSGEGPSAIARRFEVSRFYVYQVRDREQETGVRSSFQIGGHRRSRLEAAEPALRNWIAAEPGLTLAELQERLAAQGITTWIGALWHQLNKWNLTFKKKPARQRARTRGRVGSAAGMDVAKLVFIDETWATTNLTRSYGRAPKGCRCIGLTPLGDWQTTTFVVGLRHQRLTAPMVVDGPMDGELFLAWVEQFLCSTLQAGDTVILDNLSSHK